MSLHLSIPGAETRGSNSSEPSNSCCTGGGEGPGALAARLTSLFIVGDEGLGAAADEVSWSLKKHNNLTD